MTKELQRYLENLLQQITMDPMMDLEKMLSTQTKVEDVEIKRNLSMKSIEEIIEINSMVIEVRLIQPFILVSLNEDSM
jgi:hypothetical protein